MATSKKTPTKRGVKPGTVKRNNLKTIASQTTSPEALKICKSFRG